MPDWCGISEKPCRVQHVRQAMMAAGAKVSFRTRTATNWMSWLAAKGTMVYITGSTGKVCTCQICCCIATVLGQVLFHVSGCRAQIQMLHPAAESWRAGCLPPNVPTCHCPPSKHLPLKAPHSSIRFGLSVRVGGCHYVLAAAVVNSCHVFLRGALIVSRALLLTHRSR